MTAGTCARTDPVFYASGTVFPLLDADGTVTGFVKIARDLTERKQYEDALQQAHDELEQRVLERTDELERENRERRANEGRVRRLLQRLVTVQEDERRRIARDLHDHFGQQMTALRLNLAAIRDRAKDASIIELAQNADQLAEQLDGDVDFLAWDLRPAALDDVGLADTLRRFMQEWSAHYGIGVDFHTAGLDGDRLAPVVETNLYRIAQEAMNNVYKHARASHVDVILERRGCEGRADHRRRRHRVRRGEGGRQHRQQGTWVERHARTRDAGRRHARRGDDARQRDNRLRQGASAGIAVPVRSPHAGSAALALTLVQGGEIAAGLLQLGDVTHSHPG